MVISLSTQFTGRSERGRMYLPGPAVSNVTSAGRFATTNRNDIRDAAVALLASTSAPDNVSVLWSRKNVSLTPLDSLRVGDVFDAQRRRRDKLTELYSAGDIT